jgi:hypothetical protein
MAENKNQQSTEHVAGEKQPDKQPENPRVAIRKAREHRLRVIAGPPNTVKVFAGSEALRGSLRHPSGARFRDNLDEAVEWPNDSFTARRIADGSVRTDKAGPAESPEADPTQNPREQAEANKPKAEKSEERREPKPEQRTTEQRGQRQPPQSPPPAA